MRYHGYLITFSFFLTFLTWDQSGGLFLLPARWLIQAGRMCSRLVLNTFTWSSGSVSFLSFSKLANSKPVKGDDPYATITKCLPLPVAVAVSISLAWFKLHKVRGRVPISGHQKYLIARVLQGKINFDIVPSLLYRESFSLFSFLCLCLSLCACFFTFNKKFITCVFLLYPRFFQPFNQEP